MFFSIGAFEGLAILATLAVASLAYASGHSSGRWFLATAMNLILAACLSPSDLLSTVVLVAAFMAAFAVGLRVGSAGQAMPV